MATKKALLITYYWPPSGGAGVHRWLRFSRFFKENGWDLTVYCPENAEWPIIDRELEKSVPDDITVIRRPIFEPHKYLGKKNNPSVGGGITQAKKSNLLQRTMIWVRGNLFIPDARMFWIRPSQRYLHKYLKAHPEIDTVISTGPPHSMHLIARKLKQRHPHLNWVADFRDPWTEIDFYADLMIGKRADRLNKRMEKAVLTEADRVITVSEACATGLEAISGKSVEVITNGFIFPEFDPRSVPLDTSFTIAHYGSMPFSRNPEVLWKALAAIAKADERFAAKLKINLVGAADFSVIERIRFYDLERFLQLTPAVSHAESIMLQRTTPVLLLVGNNSGNVKGILTGKFFEYLGAKRPILTVGATGSDLDTVVRTTQCGAFVDYSDETQMIEILRKWYDQFSRNELYKEPVNTEQFSSAVIVKQLLDLIEKPLFSKEVNK